MVKPEVTKSHSCQALWLGRMDYQAAWDMQNHLAEEVAKGMRGPVLMLLEHPHTYTIGRRGDGSNLLWDETMLKEKGISVIWVDRGGDITYHGPGQLVGYPILPLAAPGWHGERLPGQDFVGYVRKLEETLILALKGWDIDAFTIDGKTGVWVTQQVKNASGDPYHIPAKIASIGVKVDVRGITRHGFALNLQPDMSYWEGIIPCGLQGVAMTAVASLSTSRLDILHAARDVAQAFSFVFHMNMDWVSST
jgi:lipoyl(octanoyl) transferase